MSSRFALVIGNTEYEDQKLARLRSPVVDVDGLSRVLEDQELGAFDNVLKVVNQPKGVIERRISALFAGKQSDDLLVLYFSGHGVRDEDGQLYLAVSDTDHNDLDGTAIIGSFIARVMNKSSSRRQVLILDCCHSGAFSSGFKGAKGEEIGVSVGTKSVFETPGYGRIVLTASDSTQYAWEGEQVIGESEDSVYTHFLIQGMRTGDADVRGIGKITVDELHNYAYQQVVARTSKQRPQRFGAKEEGQLIVSKAPLKIAELPVDIRNALRSGFPGIRQAAIEGLLDLVRNGAPGQILAAHAALTRLLDDDSLSVRKIASEALSSYTANELNIEQALLNRVATEAHEQQEQEQEQKQQTDDFRLIADRGQKYEEQKKEQKQQTGEALLNQGTNQAGDQDQEKREEVRDVGQTPADKESPNWLGAVLFFVGIIFLIIVVIALSTPGSGPSAPSGTTPQTSVTQPTSNPTVTAALSAADMNKMGENYYYGQGVSRDYRQAREWYLKAAAAGDHNAMYSLGVMYERGQGGAQNYQRARQWYLKAAAAGDDDAMNNLGALYANGEGVTRDHQEAYRWFLKAANAGDHNAMYNLGSLYEHGQGVTQDYQQARQWYEKAAAAGDKDAKRRLQEWNSGLPVK